MMRALSVAAVLAASLSSAVAADPAIPAGTYLLSANMNPEVETRMSILKVGEKDGKPTFEVVANNPQFQLSFGDPAIEKGLLKLPITVGGRFKISFEGVLDANKPKEIRGSLGDDSAQLFRAALVPTELEDLKGKDASAPAELPTAFKDARKFYTIPQELRMKARREKDADARTKLLDEATAAEKEANEKAPALFKEVVKDNAGTAAAGNAALELIGRAAKIQATPAEVESWAKAAFDSAGNYGPRLQAHAVGILANSLVGQKGYEALAIPYAEKLTADEKQPAAKLVNAMKVLAVAQSAAGKADAAAATQKKIDAMELKLDEEYVAKVPPYKPTKFEGRKDEKANRVVLVELFTGAQCPPCVAADIGFDGLVKAYEPKDVVLLQYHMHIPGPDPLTNPDTVARWKYYGGLHADKVRGTPTALFNGTPNAGGGGGMDLSEKKFEQFKGLIDPLLEEKTDVSVTATATETDGTITATATVGGIKEPKNEHKLRFVLIEDNVRYLGGNGVRFHHHVVRSFMGTGDGVKVKDLKDGKFATTLKVADLKKSLSTYLEEFGAKELPFPNRDRPLDLKHLKLVAVVQDDESGEVLQAVQVPVGDK